MPTRRDSAAGRFKRAVSRGTKSSRINRRRYRRVRSAGRFAGRSPHRPTRNEVEAFDRAASPATISSCRLKLTFPCPWC